MKFFNIFLILANVWNGVAFFTQPFIDIGPLTIFGYPDFRQDTTKLTTRVPFWASEFDLNIIFLRFHSLEAPLLQFLLGKKTKFLFFFVGCSRLWGVDAQKTHSLTSTDVKAEIKGHINCISINNLFK